MRLMIYDRTCVHTGGIPVGLTHSWIVGARLYGAMGRFDAWYGAADWTEALEWAARHEGISEIQFWGHGNWGLARIGSDRLDATALRSSHRLHAALESVRANFSPEGLWWFRTCDTLGADRGHGFARRWTDFFGGSVAGHTHIIGPWQSGLHRLQAGAKPHWPATEGVREGTAGAPRRSTWSVPGLPNTIHCLRGRIPEGW